ncbi:hypothetical protein CA850_22650 [Micromonospora echinospora]|nr:hypothetical protein CA850_22650 [Micromonospora echinospora]
MGSVVRAGSFPPSVHRAWPSTRWPNGRRQVRLDRLERCCLPIRERSYHVSRRTEVVPGIAHTRFEE